MRFSLKPYFLGEFLNMEPIFVKICVKWHHKNLNFSKSFRPISTKFDHSMSNWCRIRYTNFLSISATVAELFWKTRRRRILPPPPSSPAGRDLNETVIPPKNNNYWLTQVPLPHLEAIHWLTQYTATSGTGERVVRVSARLKTKKKTNIFVVRNYFAFQSV